MINLSIAANTTEDLHEKLKGILHGLAQAPAAIQLPPVQPQSEKNEVDAVVTLEPPKPKTTRKKTEPVAETIVEPEPPVEAKVETPTLDDVRGALKTYATAVFKAGVAAGKEELEAKNDANGAGLAVLMEIAGTTPTSAVPEGKRAAVIAEANRLLAALNVPTREDVVAALNRLSSAEGHGTEAVFDLLASFSAKSSKDIREDQRALVIAAVKQKLEG